MLNKIKEKNFKFLVLSENKDRMYQNLWDITKANLRETSVSPLHGSGTLEKWGVEGMEGLEEGLREQCGILSSKHGVAVALLSSQLLWLFAHV